MDTTTATPLDEPLDDQPGGPLDDQPGGPLDDQPGGHSPQAAARAPHRPPQRRQRTLTRRRHDRMIGGVASGIAGYMGIDTTLVRIAFAVLTIVGGAGIPLYLACWLLIPEEGAERSIASDFAGSMQAWRD